MVVWAGFSLSLTTYDNGMPFILIIVDNQLTYVGSQSGPLLSETRGPGEASLALTSILSFNSFLTSALSSRVSKEAWSYLSVDGVHETRHAYWTQCNKRISFLVQRMPKSIWSLDAMHRSRDVLRLVIYFSFIFLMLLKVVNASWMSLVRWPTSVNLMHLKILLNWLISGTGGGGTLPVGTTPITAVVLFYCWVK